MADSACTRDERRERIVAECNAVRQALQDLLSEYMANAGTFFGGRVNSIFVRRTAPQSSPGAYGADNERSAVPA